MTGTASGGRGVAEFVSDRYHASGGRGVAEFVSDRYC